MKLTNLNFQYGDKVILKDFSLSLPNKGVTALAGPSGCGKTTLLRLLAGLEAPEGRNTAFLFQENRLLPGLSAADQIRLVLPRGGDPLPWLAAVGLENEAHTLPSALSGGMQRRVALARCLAYGRDKKLLLLDEPFTGIDPERTVALMAFIRTLKVPVLYSAHDAQSLALADRIIRLDGPPLKEIV